MRKNRELYAEAYKDEIKWFKENIQTLQKSKNKFLIDMYTILITGSRKLTPKMESALFEGDLTKTSTSAQNHKRWELEILEQGSAKPLLKPIPFAPESAVWGFAKHTKGETLTTTNVSVQRWKSRRVPFPL